ncbi:MAG: DUF3800 domain-containing protein [Alphaproteobacteria bacterium]
MERNERYGYIAYVDEAGDPGVKTVKPIDKNGASEWLVLAASVIRVDFESEVPSWGREFLSQCGGRQQKHFHFRNANDQNKLLACERLSALHVRNFVVCSNKKNMRGHKNPAAAKRNVDLAANPHNSNWFYFWVTRVLMEKVTNFVAWHSKKNYGEIRKIKFEFSQRGGIRYDELNAYFEQLQDNDKRGTQTANYDTINWSTFDSDLVEVHPHNHRAGLILPDIVASSFYMAADKHERGLACNPTYALRLKPRMAIKFDNKNGTPAGFGVKLMPAQRAARLDGDQQQVFKKYGYRFD